MQALAPNLIRRDTARTVAPCQYGYPLESVVASTTLSTRKRPALHGGRGAWQAPFGDPGQPARVPRILRDHRTAAVMAANPSRGLHMSEARSILCNDCVFSQTDGQAERA